MKAKRILGLILTFMLCMNITTAVFAESTEQKAITTADEVRAFMADLYSRVAKNTNCKRGSIQKNGYARIPGVDFGDGVYTGIEVKYGVSEAYAGGTLYVYIDSMDTEPVAEIKLPSTGDFTKLDTITTDINLNISGVHSVWVKFGQTAMCDFFGLRFLGGSSGGSGEWGSSEAAGIADKLEAIGIVGLGDILAPEKVVTNADVLAVARKISPYFTMTNEEFCKKYNMTASANAKSTDVLRVFSAVAGYDKLDGEYTAASGIFKDVKYTDSQITGEALVKCIDNLLDINVLNVGPGRDEYYESDETVLNAILGIYESKGVVLSDDYTSIVGGTLPLEQVRIGGTVYFKNGLNLQSYFGKNVKTYYKEENDEYHLVYVEEYKNSELSLTNDEVIGFDNLKISYELEDTNKTKYADISREYVLIYNGLLISEFEENLFETFSGDIKLIDNNNDGNYDCIIMTDTMDVMVTAVSRDTIFGKGNYALNLENKDYIIKNSNGDVMADAELDVIKKNNVLSIGHVVGAVGTELYTITISTKTISGFVKTATFDETAVVDIDGMQYKYSKTAVDNSKSLVGSVATLYFNAKGEVVYAEKGVSESNALFGYAEEFFSDDNEEILYVTIFGQDESIVKYECAALAKVDGKWYKEYAAIKEAMEDCFKKGIVTYEVNEDGKLSVIDFPYNYVGYKNSDKNTYEHEDSLFLSYDGSNTSLRYKRDVRGFSGKTLDNDKTVVFFIPDEGDIEDYRVQPISYLAHDIAYKAKAYGMDADNYYSSVYEIKQNVGATVKDTNPVYFVVNVNLNSVWNEDEQELFSSIEYYANGAKNTVMVDPKINDEIRDLTCGDAIRIATNQNGIVGKVEKRYDVESGTVYDEDNPSKLFHHYMRVMEETVRTIDGGVAYLDTVEEIANLNTSNIVIYDSQASGARRLQSATVSDIVPGERIFIAQYYGNVKGVMILR